MTRRLGSRLLSTFWTLTLLAGLVGVVRQRAESLEVRSGALPPDGPDGDRPPSTPYGPVSVRIAGWVPVAPHSSLGRSAATIWSAPLSVVGLAVALASRARPRWDAQRRCLVATGVKGPSDAALRLVGAGANTIGQVVLCRTTTPSEALLDHEAVHVRQAERLGPLLIPLYLWLNASHGYRDNPLEHAARRGARSGRGTAEAGR